MPVTGNIGEAIVAYANDNKIEKIVMGTRGRGSVASALMGSVSKYVMKHAPCTVVVTKGEEVVWTNPDDDE